MLVKSYISHLFNRKNAYDLHSPYVFEFYNEVLKKAKKHKTTKAEKYRDECLQSKVEIDRNDFGAGSKVLKHKALVKDIARVAGVSSKYGRLLSRIIEFYNFNRALEFGTSVGIGAAFILENDEVVLTSIEGCTETANFSRKGLTKMYGNRVEVLNMTFDDENLPITGKYDFIYIDGNHKKSPTLRYFKMLLNHLSENGLMIFDDIHWSEEMEEAWNIIVEDPIITVSIDIFKFGIVSKRKGQRKEHFILKY